jgi:hypothetical protein
MTFPDNCYVEFIGGPLDGYAHAVSFPEQWIAEYIALPVNARLVSLLEGRLESDRAPATSVALYRFETQRGRPVYEFWTAAHPSDFQLENWSG